MKQTMMNGCVFVATADIATRFYPQTMIQLLRYVQVATVRVAVNVKTTKTKNAFTAARPWVHHPGLFAFIRKPPKCSYRLEHPGFRWETYPIVCRHGLFLPIPSHHQLLE